MIRHLGKLMDCLFKNGLFKNGNDDPKTDSFDEYCMPLVEINDFNALIDNKPCFLISQ